MSDRELLEMAAKAAGVEFEWKHCRFYTGPSDMYGVRELVDELTPFLSCGLFWNPLRDDGDAFRLSSKLELNVCFHGEGAEISNTCIFTDVEEGDRLRASRRAIVLAAAEIGASLS